MSNQKQQRRHEVRRYIVGVTITGRKFDPDRHRLRAGRRPFLLIGAVNHADHSGRVHEVIPRRENLRHTVGVDVAYFLDGHQRRERERDRPTRKGVENQRPFLRDECAPSDVLRVPGGGGD
ncbi:hypothetical protein D3C84_208250 [compost metagenome]